jgi:putative nucleotidyltransferase with HDIG domain
LAARVPFSANGIMDYGKAAADLRSKMIRLVYPKAFDEDPLRILRAFSLSAALGFRIVPSTMALIRKKSALLEEVAGERLRDELFKILQEDNSWSFIRAMDECGVLAGVIPQIRLMHDVAQGAYHHLDVWGHSLETVRQLERLFGQMKDPEVNAYLQESLAGLRSRRQVMKLAALLHDIGKPQAYEVKAGKTMFHGHERIGRVLSEAIAKRLKLSTKEKLAMDTMIFWHLRPGYLADNKILTPRAVHRYFRDTKDEAVSVLLVAVADQRATRGPLATVASRRRHEKVAFDLIGRYFRQLKETPLPRLLGGDDLISFFHLAPGPVFSTILRAVEEEQVEGRIRTKAQARDFVRRFLSSEKKNSQTCCFKECAGVRSRRGRRR